MRVKPVVLLEFGIDEVKSAGVFVRYFSEQALENGPGPLDAGGRVAMPFYELVNIRQPNLIKAGPLEIGKRELKHPEGLLEVGVVPKKVSVVEQHQRGQAALLLASLESRLYCFEVA